jgi:4,5-dihydroxyphthalate decarboxylase
MAKLQLSLACANYDRVRALLDGRTPIDGVDIVPTILEPSEAFHRAFKYQEFDITELSLSSHTMVTSRGNSAYVGVPVFPSRVFRHSGIYVRTDRIKRPEDLRGKRVGVPEYQITANVWIRGILLEEYGVKPEEVKWRRGGIGDPGRDERTPLKLPPTIDLQPLPAGKTLSGMLEAGELDAVISARALPCFMRGAPDVGRLFADYRTIEEDYFRRTGIFPIMHLIGIRKSLVEKHPWLPVNVYKAFLHAKAIAVQDLNIIGHLMVTLPWVVHEYNAVKALMGDDYWPYGLAANEKQLETFTRYHHEQGLSAQKVAARDLFAPSTLDLSKT